MKEQRLISKILIVGSGMAGMAAGCYGQSPLHRQLARLAGGWCVTTRNALKQMPKMLPGLTNFYMVGQWTMPFSGVSGAAMSGRQAIQMVCKADGKR